MISTENVSNADEILDRELAQEIFAKEIYLPWVHENHPFCVGHYFGYVDYARRPHGPNGTWTCACPFEGRAYQVKGRWCHGSIISDEKKKSLLLKTNHSQHNATGDRDDRNSKSHSKNETTAGDDASIEIYQHWRSSRQTLQDSLSRRNNLTIDVKDEVDFFYIYCVGYRLRSQQHAMETGNENLKSIKEMSNYQFAFIKRSDSTWTYAFLSRRLFQPRGVSNYNKQRLLEESEVVEEEAMEFVVEVYKSSRLEANAVDKIITKVIPESKYGSFIRCRSPDIFGRVTSEKDIVVGDNRERRGIYEWVASSTKSLFTARSA